MKRYDGYILRFINHEGGAREQEPAEVYLADETDKTIMNMVNEFAETAKEYEAEIAKEKERADINFLSYERVKEKYSKTVVELSKKDEEIARLRKALEYYGNRENWMADISHDSDRFSRSPIVYDHGEMARETLERKSP